MALDRDIGVAVAPRLAAGGAAGSWTAWEMLSATGVRGLRLLSESSAFRRLILTERNRAAVDVLARNAERFAARGARAVRADARRPVAASAFDYVDLDPFGSPLPYLERAVVSVRDGGVLAVTATDLAVLAGAAREPCERRYGARPLSGRLGPEGGLRILLAVIERRARVDGRSTRPLLAYVLGHHLRAYVRLEAREATASTVAEIPGPSWEGPPLPPGRTFGPMWVGPIIDPEFASGLEVPERAAHPLELKALIERWRGESRIPVPLFYEPNEMARELRLPSPPSIDRLLEALIARGFTAARSHVRPSAVRTTAPWPIVAEIARRVAPSSVAAGR